MSTPEEPKTNAMDDAQLGEVNGGVRICQVETSDPIPVAEYHGPVAAGARKLDWDQMSTNY